MHVTRDSFIVVKGDDSLQISAAEKYLPKEYCIVKVEELKNLNDINDLKQRALVAEGAYNKLLSKYYELCERFNYHE